MKYVYLTDNLVTDQCQIDPYNVFSEDYASLFIEAPDEVTFGWKLENGEWFPPAGPTPEEIQAQNKSQAEQLLQQTDWTQIADVDLVNKADFTAYRAEVRAIALNPPVTVAQWPTKPEEIWAE
jgi:hypothetical protein